MVVDGLGFADGAGCGEYEMRSGADGVIGRWREMGWRW